MGTSMGRTWRAFTSLATTGLVVAVLAGCGGSGGERTTAELSTLDSIIPSAPSEIPDFESPAEPVDGGLPTPPTDPVDAVESYLAAERSGEIERSSRHSHRRAPERRLGRGLGRDQVPAPDDRRLRDRSNRSGAPAGAPAVIVRGRSRSSRASTRSAGSCPQHADVDWRGRRRRRRLADRHRRLVAAARSCPTSTAPPRPQRLGGSPSGSAAIDGEYAGSLLGSPALGDQLCGLEGDARRRSAGTTRRRPGVGGRRCVRA